MSMCQLIASLTLVGIDLQCAVCRFTAGLGLVLGHLLGESTCLMIMQTLYLTSQKGFVPEVSLHVIIVK